MYFLVVNFINVSNVLKPITQYNTDKCQLLQHPLLGGCESAKLLDSSSVLMACAVNITERDLWFPASGKFGKPTGKSQGALVRLDLNTHAVTQLQFANFKDHFVPHGVGFIASPDDSNLVYIHAVNHHINGSRIEMFEYRLGDTLMTHYKTVASELLPNPNDVLPLSRDSFYATNDLKYARSILRTPEVFLAFPGGKIMLYSDGTFKEAATNIQYANGIEASSDKQTVYVVSSTGSFLHIYKRRRSNSLQLMDAVKLPLMGDNVSIDEDGNALIAGIANGLHWLKHAEDHSAPSGSKVVRVAPNTGQDIFYGKKYTVTEIYSDDGTVLSGIANAVASKETKKVVLSTVFTQGVLVCKGI